MVKNITHSSSPTKFCRASKRSLRSVVRNCRGTTANLHTDHARAHTATKAIPKIEELGFIRVPRAPYSPNTTPWDFFLFSHLKGKLGGMQFVNEDEVMSAVIQVPEEIPLKMSGE
jgi:hypothetical protein